MKYKLFALSFIWIVLGLNCAAVPSAKITIDSIVGVLKSASWTSSITCTRYDMNGSGNGEVIEKIANNNQWVVVLQKPIGLTLEQIKQMSRSFLLVQPMDRVRFDYDEKSGDLLLIFSGELKKGLKPGDTLALKGVTFAADDHGGSIKCDTIEWLANTSK